MGNDIFFYDDGKTLQYFSNYGIRRVLMRLELKLIPQGECYETF